MKLFEYKTCYSHIHGYVLADSWDEAEKKIINFVNSNLALDSEAKKVFSVTDMKKLAEDHDQVYLPTKLLT